jgi:hypothetical protein
VGSSRRVAGPGRRHPYPVQRLGELEWAAERAVESVSRELEAWEAFPPLIEADEIISSLEARLEQHRWRWSTAQERSQDLTTLGQARDALEQLRAQVVTRTEVADQRRIAALTARLQAVQPRLESEPPTPWEGTELDELEWDIRQAEGLQQRAEEPGYQGQSIRDYETGLREQVLQTAERIRPLVPRWPRGSAVRPVQEADRTVGATAGQAGVRQARQGEHPGIRTAARRGPADARRRPAGRHRPARAHRQAGRPPRAATLGQPAATRPAPRLPAREPAGPGS